MKLTTIMYLYESVNQKALRARNLFFLMNLIASLVKLLYKLVSLTLIGMFGKNFVKI